MASTGDTKKKKGSEPHYLERLRLEKLFYSLDENDDGFIDPQELAKGLRKMGYTHVTEAQLRVKEEFYKGQGHLKVKR